MDTLESLRAPYLAAAEADIIRAEIEALDPGAVAERETLEYCLDVELRLAARP